MNGIVSVNIWPQELQSENYPPITVQLLFPASTGEPLSAFTARAVETHFCEDNPFLPPKDSWASLNSNSTFYTSPTFLSRAIVSEFECNSRDETSSSVTHPRGTDTITTDTDDAVLLVSPTSQLDESVTAASLDLKHNEAFRRSVTELSHFAESSMCKFLHARVFDYIERRLLATRVYSQFVHRDTIKDGWITPSVKSHESFIRKLILVSFSFIHSSIHSLSLHSNSSLSSLPPLPHPSPLRSHRKSMNTNLVMHSLTHDSPPFLLSSMLSHN